MANNIVLVGFMGVGKGQVGRGLSKKTGKFVIDCDDLIESALNTKIRKFFKKEGEASFRQKEKEVAAWLEESVTNTIVSTGGGFVNVENLKRIGEIIFLYAEFDVILRRIRSHPNAEKKIKKRPLLQDLDKAKKLYTERMPIYKSVADVVVDVSEKTVEQVVDEIIFLLK